jgi:hypothetical protein
MSLFYIIFTCEYTHEVSAVPPDSPCISCSVRPIFYNFAKIAEHKCAEDLQSEMFKYGPFLNLQYFELFITATGCPKRSHPHKSISTL